MKEWYRTMQIKQTTQMGTIMCNQNAYAHVDRTKETEIGKKEQSIIRPRKRKLDELYDDEDSSYDNIYIE